MPFSNGNSALISLLLVSDRSASHHKLDYSGDRDTSNELHYDPSKEVGIAEAKFTFIQNELRELLGIITKQGLIITSLNDEIIRQHRVMDGINDKNEELISDMQDLKEENENLIKVLQSTNTEKSTKQGFIIESLNTEIIRQQRLVIGIDAENEELISDMQDLNEENENLIKELHSTNTEKSTKQGLIIESLKDKIIRQHQVVDGINDKNEELISDMQELKEENENLIKELQSTKTEKRTKQGLIIESLNNKIIHQYQVVDDINDKNQELISDMQDLKEENENLVKELQSTNTENNTKQELVITSFHDQISRQHRAMDGINDKNEELISDMQDLKEENENLIKELQSTNTEKSTKQGLIIESLNDEIIRQHQVVIGIDAENEELISDVQDLIEENEILIKELHSTKAAKSQLDVTDTQLRQENFALMEQLEKTSSGWLQEAEVEELKRQTTELLIWKLKARREETNELKDRLMSLDAERDGLAEQLAKAMDRISELSSTDVAQIVQTPGQQLKMLSSASNKPKSLLEKVASIRFHNASPPIKHDLIRTRASVVGLTTLPQSLMSPYVDTDRKRPRSLSQPAIPTHSVNIGKYALRNSQWPRFSLQSNQASNVTQIPTERLPIVFNPFFQVQQIFAAGDFEDNSYKEEQHSSISMGEGEESSGGGFQKKP